MSSALKLMLDVLQALFPNMTPAELVKMARDQLRRPLTQEELDHFLKLELEANRRTR